MDKERLLVGSALMALQLKEHVKESTDKLMCSYDMTIGAKLREYRISVKVSIRTLAKSMDVSAVYISDLERGKRSWSESLIRKHIEHTRSLSRQETAQ